VLRVVCDRVAYLQQQPEASIARTLAPTGVFFRERSVLVFLRARGMIGGVCDDHTRSVQPHQPELPHRPSPKRSISPGSVDCPACCPAVDRVAIE
jgi:hypothetical protein